MGFLSLGAHALAYKLPSSEPTGREPPVVSIYRGLSIHISMCGIPSCSGADIHILIMGLPPLGRAPLWDFSHAEVNSIVGFTPTRRYRIVTLIYLEPQLGVDASNLSLDNILTSGYFFAGSTTNTSERGSPLRGGNSDSPSGIHDTPLRDSPHSEFGLYCRDFFLGVLTSQLS